MLSFWETTQLTRFDLVVIGGGLVGLSTAIHYRKDNPEARIAILERGVFPSGASTKNAGFLCFGSIDELSDHLEEMPQDELLALVERRYRGGLRLRELLGDQRIGYEPCGGYELHTHQLEHTVIERFNDMLRPLFADNVYQDATDEIQSNGFSSDRVATLIRNQFEGVIHTGKMIRAYQEMALEHGIMTFTQTECHQYHEKEDAVDVEITHLGERITLSTQKLALCTNAFTSRWLPKEDITPGRGLVFVTKPRKGVDLRGCFHYNSGYNYFRSVEGRLLLGGGRHLDKKTESTTDPGINQHIYDALVLDMHEMISPNEDLEIDHVWSGVMAFGATKGPIVKKVSDRIALGARLGGMGVALGTEVGFDVAALLTT